MARPKPALPHLAPTVIATMVVAGVLAMAACHPTQIGLVETPTPTVAAATPTPSATPELAPTPTLEPTPLAGACADMPGLQPRSDDVEDRVHGYFVANWKDAGPREGASGEAAIGEDGKPAAYVVAEGDVPFAIAERFCIGYVPYLAWLNSIRRDSGYSIGVNDSDFAIYPGDTLNLSPWTIASVGDENGVVYDNTPSFHIPPQR